MRIALMQPTFLPWAGYLNMVTSCDKFIFLDDVQISPKSFQVRNRIPSGDGSFKWIGVKEESGLPINQRLMNSTSLQETDLTYQTIENQLNNSYSTSEELTELLSSLKQNLEKNATLAELNISLLGKLFQIMGVKFEYLLSSESGLSGTGSERIVQLLRNQDCSQYLVAPGSIEYMSTEDIWSSVNFQMLVYNYIPTEYPQKGQRNFMSHMSSIDILLELGSDKARENIFETEFELKLWKKG